MKNNIITKAFIDGNPKKICLDILMWAAGSAIYSAGVSFFIAPLRLASGGITGIGILINHIFSFIPIGVFVFAANIPLFIIAWKVFGLKFIVRTIFATAFSSFFLDLFPVLANKYELAFGGDEKIVGAIFGGILMGAGLGIVFLGGATTGGTDILVKLIKLKFPHFSTGKLVLFADLAVVIASGIVFRSFDSVLYSIIAIFLSSLAIDYIISGKSHSKMLLIVTSQPDDVADGIMKICGRGVSIIHAEGAYTRKEKEMLLCAVKAHEVADVRKIVEKYDSHPFIIIMDSSEVIGLGFKSYKDTL